MEKEEAREWKSLLGNIMWIEVEQPDRLETGITWAVIFLYTNTSSLKKQI